MRQVSRFAFFEQETPALIAAVRGSADFPDVRGEVHAFWLPDEIFLQMEFTGLPPSRVMGLHIHSGLACGVAAAPEPFSEAGGHFTVCEEGMWCSRHPYHAGDLPPLFSDEYGNAFAQVFIDRTNVREVSGKPIVVHALPDDFKTQPAGASGVRIACGLLAENL